VWSIDPGNSQQQEVLPFVSGWFVSIHVASIVVKQGWGTITNQEVPGCGW
jgi:hypothetical protein